LRDRSPFILLLILTLIFAPLGVAYSQNRSPVITDWWVEVDYYDYWDNCYGDYCDEYAVIKGRVEAYDPDGDRVFYTWYVDGMEADYGDSLWYEVWSEGEYEIYVKVEDEYGLSTWAGPRYVKVDFDWWCGGGCSSVSGSRFNSMGLLLLLGAVAIPLLRRG